MSSNDLLENTSKASTLRGGSPSGNSADGALSVPGQDQDEDQAEDQDQDENQDEDEDEDDPHHNLNLLFHAGGQANCSNVGSHAENRFVKLLDCDNLIWPK